MHKAKNRPRKSFHLGQRKGAFKHCRDCNAFYVLVGGKKYNEHVCGDRVEHHYEKAQKAKGWKKSRK